MIDAVRATGRETVFSVCEWGEARPWLWASQMGGTLWRTTEDIRDSWMSVLGILDQQVGLDMFAGSGAFNDPDMLEVGNGKMTHDQYVAHFSLWALLNAPLIAGNDVRTMNDSTRAILMNKDVIEVDQDFFLHQGFRLRNDGAQQVWAKPMSDGGWTVVLLNRAPRPAAIQVTMRELQNARAAITPPGGARRGGSSARPTKIQDLWSKDSVPLTEAIQRTVPATGAVMLRIR
jgi:alpha-galactosidase